MEDMTQGQKSFSGKFLLVSQFSQHNTLSKKNRYITREKITLLEGSYGLNLIFRELHSCRYSKTRHYDHLPLKTTIEFYAISHLCILTTSVFQYTQTSPLGDLNGKISL